MEQSTATQKEVQTTDQPRLSLGQYRVGISFNPGGNQDVNDIKDAAAGLIDLIERKKQEYMERTDPNETYSEVMRLFSLAQTHVEDAAMWAVKAVTKPTR